MFLAFALDTVLEAAVGLKLFKCSFGGRTAKILGHVVDGGAFSLWTSV